MCVDVTAYVISYFFILTQIRLQFQKVTAPNRLAAMNYNMICAAVETDEYCSRRLEKKKHARVI